MYKYAQITKQSPLQYTGKKQIMISIELKTVCPCYLEKGDIENARGKSCFYLIYPLILDMCLDTRIYIQYKL